MKQILFIALLLLSVKLPAQQVDTTAILAMLRQADEGLPGSINEEKVLEALSLSQKAEFSAGIRTALKMLSEKQLHDGNSIGALRYAILLMRTVEKENHPADLFDVYLRIGRIYEREQYYRKALAYYQQAEEQATKAGREDDLLRVQTLIADALLDNDQPQEAQHAFLQLLDRHEKAGSYKPTMQTLQKLADASVALKDFPKAKEYYQQIKALSEQHNDPASTVMALNNLGFVENQLSNFAEAVNYFSQAEALANVNPALPPELVFTNAGVAYHNMGEAKKSVEYLHRAEATGNEDKSYLQHLLATIYLKNKDVYNALRYTESAVKSAEKTKNATVLCDAYEVASQIHQQLFEYEKALDYYKKHLALKDSLLRDERLRLQDLENLHARMERTENEVRQNLADEEVRQLTINQLQLKTHALELESEKQRLEADRQEKQIALLRREQEIKDANLRATRLEAERTQQALRLATQELLAEKQSRQIASLSQQRRLDSLEAAQQAAAQAQQIALLEREQEITQLQVERQQVFEKNAYRLGGLLALILFVISGSWLYARRLNSRLAEKNRQIELQKQELDAEHARAETLLLNILPVEVAEELKNSGAATPRQYPSATVMFTDFMAFTSIAGKMSAGEVVQELNDFFLEFDKIIERHRLEKIKTMGDSYMCAGGLPVPNESHPVDAVSAALEILDFVKKSNRQRIAQGKQEWQMRIGIHTGEVVAGVVGSKKFAYDIWGDTVNVASRMESTCLPGQINISEATYSLVKNRFDCTYRGEVEVKNKGMMGMYLVQSSSVFQPAH